MPSLLFDAVNHKYTLDGVDAVSVSEIVRSVTGKSYSAVDPEVLEAARVRGEAIHADVENGTYSSREAWWIAETVDLIQCRFEIMGHATIDGLLYAGRADIVAPGEIYDIKTGSSKDILSWTLQINLYARMFDGIEYLTILWTPKNKPAKEVQIKKLDDATMSKVIDAYCTGRIIGNEILEPEDMITRAFRVSGTTDQIKAVSAFMNSLGIDYERMNK